MALSRQGETSSRSSRTIAMNAAFARNWWAVGLRGVAGGLLLGGVLLLPQPTLAAFILMFAAYVAADGLLAIIAGSRAMRRRERWGALIFEGSVNLLLAGTVLVWPAIAAVAFIRLVSAWALVTGAILLAAARRLTRSHGRWLIAVAGAVSAVWGVMAAAVGPTSESAPQTVGWWLIGYALPFAATMLVLTGVLRKRREQFAAAVSPSA